MSTPDWPRPVVHWHLEARDLEKLRAFYAELFSWRIGDGPIANVEAGFGGPEPGPAGHLQEGAGGFSLYIQVRDIPETLRRAEALGGSVRFGSFDVPGGPTIAGIADPEGNPLTLVQQ
jgi:predicted enzyme related to lactoylglutathione lyase